MNNKCAMAMVCIILLIGTSIPKSVTAGGFPVIDIAGLIQHVLNIEQQVRQWQELVSQYERMGDQLRTQVDTLDRMRGWRDMGNIINNQYLDQVLADAQDIIDWLEEWDVILKDGDYFENTYPDDPVLAQEEREIFEGHLQHISEWAAEANTYLTRAENRVPELQNLIDVALPAAADQKAVLDLIARTGAENALLTNELIMLIAQQSQRNARSEMTQQQASQTAMEFVRGNRVPLPPIP